MDEFQNDSALADLPFLPEAPPPGLLTIRKWSVVGNDRIMGNVFNRSKQVEGKTIMTSPVVQVRLLGELRTPVAFTQSGSAYWLAEPAAGYGIERAARFVAQKVRMAAPAPAKPDPSLETTVLKLA